MSDAGCGGKLLCLQRVGYIVIFFSLILLHLCFKFWTPERETFFLVTKRLQFILSLGFAYGNFDFQLFSFHTFPSWYIYFVLSNKR